VIDILQELNEEQRRAVLCEDGPVLVLAGAGSGKTRVLTYRIAYLIGERNIPPGRILAMTFTNKAADEMKERLKQMLGERIKSMWVGTFHSICARILREHAERLGYTRDYSIYDEEDRERIIKRIIEQEELRISPGQAVKVISRLKQGLISPDECSGDDLACLYSKYNEKLKENNAMDFDDLLMNTIRLFENHPAVREIYARRFLHVLVDEYQDTNRAQYVILKHITSIHRNLFVVGDDDQSKYSFRGAEIRNILDFEKDFPDVKIYKLERNYRSTGNILKVASNLVAHNRGRKEKVLWTDASDGEPVMVIEKETEYDESLEVARIVERELERTPPGEIAVLYRANYLSRSIEEALRRKNIPYRVVGGIRFYERKEIKDVLSYLRIMVNPRDDESMLRIINTPPRGIGKATLRNLLDIAEERKISLFDALEFTDIPALSSFRSLLHELMDEKEDVRDAVRAVLNKTGYLSYLEESGKEEDLNRIENLEELVSSIDEWVRRTGETSVSSYLSTISLYTEIDRWDKSEMVNLMTLHNTKGLEFEVVIITGVEDGILPHRRSLEEGNEEEERRLFYVGITRAKKRLYILYSRARGTSWGPSRFLGEIGREGVKFVGSPERGRRVFHPYYGEGIVIGVEDGGRKITVDFGTFTKKFIVDLAPLKFLDNGDY